MGEAYDIPGTNYSIAASNYTFGEVVTHCRKPDCFWLSLPHLAALNNPPPLLPNPDISGIGVILGFSITAYLTLALLILHYLTVHDVQRTAVVNVVDNGLLTFFRHRAISWKPSRRFEYAMEKSVLILSDTQLVTGLGILAAGYSQLKCGISAYHWQIMVFVAWFASFSFLSAITFLEGYFQTNNNMRLIRVGFMFILASLLIGALLPTGSRNWLDLYKEGEGYYPSLSTVCFYRQIAMGSYLDGGPKIWSMIFSVFIVAISYLHCGIRLFDPGAAISHRYLRAWPGTKIKHALYFLERKALRKGLQAQLWTVPYLALYAIFACCRAFCDISGSMLLECIWLSFAIAWGTIKVWSTRAVADFNFDGSRFSLNSDVSEENSWSFGQTLPLVLILLPLLSMAQAYLDNDAKSQDARQPTSTTEKRHDSNDEHNAPDSSKDTSLVCCNHHPSLPLIEPLSAPPSPSPNPLLPRYPYSFSSLPWYHDLIFLLLCQTLMLTAFSLWILTEFANILGISAILRNRLFLLWVFGMVPLMSFVQLVLWYVAAMAMKAWSGGKGEGRRWNGRVGKWVYWGLRMGLVGGCLMFTLFASLEAASPMQLVDSL